VAVPKCCWRRAVQWRIRRLGELVEEHVQVVAAAGPANDREHHQLENARVPACERLAASLREVRRVVLECPESPVGKVENQRLLARVGQTTCSFEGRLVRDLDYRR
jgi:hypothetical protein